MAIFPSTAIPSGASDFTIPYSCRFNEADDPYLSLSFGTPTNRKIWTFSVWFKRGSDINDSSERRIFSTATGAGGNTDNINWTTGDAIRFIADFGQLICTPVFRDPSAWYHLIYAYDSTQGVEANRLKMYINGTQITSFSTSDYPSLNQEIDFNSAVVHDVGRNLPESTQYYDGYMAEAHFIDGTALTPTSFGETGDYGEWKPIEVSGLTYGNNGFYLDFADAADLGDDESGEGNDFAENNIVATDQMLDSPTNNFCTMNPLANQLSATLSEGNLKVVPSTANDKNVFSTFGFTSGKWYVEVHNTVQGAESHYVGSGVMGSPIGISDINHAGDLSAGNSATFRTGTGVVTAGTATVNSNNTAAVTGDIMTIAFDADNGSFWCAKNAAPNTATTANVTGLTATPDRDYRFGQQESNSSPYTQCTWNFGQDSSFAGEETAQGNQDSNDIGDFYYTPPTDFLALCTSNLPDVAVVPSEHYNTVTFTGDGASSSHPATQSVSVGFQPDFVWLKNRSEARASALFDSVRGVTKGLRSDTTAAEATSTAGYDFTSFETNGFTVGEPENWNSTNEDGTSIVAWNWKANGTGSANTDGNMAETVTVSANADAGFSIVTYTGDGAVATVGHGLSKAPELILVKQRSDAQAWIVYHSGIASDAETDILVLNATSAASDSATYWNDTAPTADVFTLGTHAQVNGDDSTYVAYCFHSVDGFSKMGSYTGNGSTDGTFVYTSFAPAYILWKNITDAGTNWVVFDNKRDTFNPNDDALYPNTTDDEEEDYDVDFVSNGFKFRNTSSWANSNGKKYIYMAFAETPFKYSNAR